jgi:hypothetical protein
MIVLGQRFVDPARRDSRIFEHAFDDCFDRAGQNPDCPRSMFAVSAPAEGAGRLRISLVGGEEDAVARSGIAVVTRQVADRARRLLFQGGLFVTASTPLRCERAWHR